MYASGPAHNLLICNDDLSFRWFVSQPADIYVSCTKGTEFYLCTLTICIFSLGKTHTEKKKNPKPTSERFQRLFWCFSASHKMVQSTNKDGHVITVLVSALSRSCFDSMGFYCSAAKDGNLC